MIFLGGIMKKILIALAIFTLFFNIKVNAAIKTIEGITYTLTSSNYNSSEFSSSYINGVFNYKKYLVYNRDDNTNVIFNDGEYDYSTVTDAEILESRKHPTLLPDYYVVGSTGNAEELGILLSESRIINKINNSCYILNSSPTIDNSKSYYINNGTNNYILVSNPDINNMSKYYYSVNCTDYFGTAYYVLSNTEVTNLNQIKTELQSSGSTKTNYTLSDFKAIKINNKWIVGIKASYLNEQSIPTNEWYYYDLLGNEISVLKDLDYQYLSWSELAKVGIGSNLKNETYVIFDKDFNVLFNTSLTGDEYPYLTASDENNVIIDESNGFSEILTRYVALEGDNQYYDGNTLSYKITGNPAFLGNVVIDNSIVSKENYVVGTDEFTITFKKNFIDSFDIGTHNVNIYLTNSGQVLTSFRKGTASLININEVENGVVTSNKELAELNDIVNLTITPNEGYKISSVKILKKSDNSDITSLVKYNSNTKSFTMPNYEVMVKVIFSEIGSSTAIESVPVVSLLPVNYNTIKVSWESVVNASSYDVYCSISSTGKYVLLGNVSELNYIHTGRTVGKTYYYKVIAKNDTDTSDFSVVKYITLKMPTPVITNSKLNYYSAGISWTKIDGASGYIIYRSTDGKKWSKYKTLGSTYSSYTNTGLTVNTSYYYKIKTYRKIGTKIYYSSYSNTLTLKPYLNTTTVTGYNTYYQYAKISYTKVNGASGYKVFRSDSENGTYKTLGYTTSTNYYDKTAVEGKTYYYKVRPYRTINRIKKYGTTSQSASAMRINDSITFSLIPSDYNAITLTINKLTDATTYYIYRSTSKSGTYQLIKTLEASTFEGDTITYANTGRTLGKYYYYKVKAKRTNVSSYSSYKYAKTILQAPNANLFNEETQNTITISQVNGASGYQIYRSYNGGKYSLVKTTTSLTYVNSGLKSGYSNLFTYKVRAYRVVNNTKIYSNLTIAEPPLER